MVLGLATVSLTLSVTSLRMSVMIADITLNSGVSFVARLLRSPVKLLTIFLLLFSKIPPEEMLPDVFFGVGIRGGGALASFLGRPCILQKKTDSSFGDPGILLVEGGDPSRDLLLGGGEPNKVLLEGAWQDADCEGGNVELFPCLF